LKVFITGGTTGLGFEIAKLYLKDGAEVGVCGRDLSKLPKDFTHQNLKAYQVDVSNREELINAVDEFVGNGELDLMLANAGVSDGDKLRLPNFEKTRKIIDINVLGVVYAFEAAFKYMVKQKRGHLAAVASVAGFVGLPAAGAYCASKSAVLTLCESYNIGLKSLGIDVTAIAPGFVDTPLTRKNKHFMPWLMPVEKGALKIKKALDKKKALFIFPWQMKLLITFLNKMPRCIYRFLMGRKITDYTQKKPIENNL
jgi:short-subunit dehydrogenase